MSSKKTDLDSLHAEFCAAILHYLEMQDTPREQWDMRGLDTHEWFEDSIGLCTNFCWFVNYKMSNFNLIYAPDIYLADKFQAAGLDRYYPFDSGSCNEYKETSRAAAIYKNPARLAWLKQHATKNT